MGRLKFPKSPNTKMVDSSEGGSSGLSQELLPSVYQEQPQVSDQSPYSQGAFPK